MYKQNGKMYTLQALSYYKIFGYPTGLGALLVHKRAVPLLKKRKRYFGGGTVAASLATEDFVRSLSLGFVPNFQSPLLCFCNFGLIFFTTSVVCRAKRWLGLCAVTDIHSVGANLFSW